MKATRTLVIRSVGCLYLSKFLLNFNNARREFHYKLRQGHQKNVVTKPEENLLIHLIIHNPDLAELGLAWARAKKSNCS